MAADEKTGKADILSHIVREHEGRISPGEIFVYSLFIRLIKVFTLGLPLSRRFVQNHEPALQLED
ncbi:MAG: hypothetical protein ABSF85_13425 [Terriglobales bacterium]